MKLNDVENIVILIFKSEYEYSPYLAEYFFNKEYLPNFFHNVLNIL